METERERLTRRAETRIRTTMVGSMEAVERILGKLWGAGKAAGELTERERAFDALREELRNVIFNLGNHQIRAIRSDITRIMQ